MITVFTDTNLFLQCKELTSLSWRDVFDDNEIMIMVPNAVVEEIDRLKQDGNNRRSKRARKTSSFFRSLISEDNLQTTIKDDHPHIKLGLNYRLAVPTENQYNLDMMRTDNQIIGEILDYIASHSFDKTVFLTHDVIAALTARRCNLQAFSIPDQWLLDPEPDSKDKRISELEKELKKLQANHPKIEIIPENENSEIVKRLLLTITTYDALSEQKIDHLISEAQRKCPLVTNFGAPKSSNQLGYNPSLALLAQGQYYRPPSQEAIIEYTERQYPEWLERLREYLNKLHKSLEFPSHQSKIGFKIINSGIVPAENMVVEFQGMGGILLVPNKEENDRSNREKEDKFPNPPIPPKGKWTSGMQTLLDMTSNVPGYDLISTTPYRNSFLPLLSNRERDRSAVYWKGNKPHKPEATFTYECKEFMHQVDPEVFSLKLLVLSNEQITKPAIKCFITATNLPTPEKLIVPVEIKFETASIEDIADRLLTDNMAKKKT